MKKLSFLLLGLTLIIIFLFLPFHALAGTFYVAQIANGDGLGGSYDNRASVTTHNAGSGNFTTLDGDTVYLCDMITSRLIVPDSGSSGNVITYRGDYTGHVSNLNIADGNMGHINYTGKDYITFQSINMQNGNFGFVTTGGSQYITIKKCVIHDQTDKAIYFHGTNGENSYITIGGADGDGNILYNVSTTTAGADIMLSHVSQFIVSYNIMYGTGSEGVDGVAHEFSQYGVIEYNKIYDHVREDGIDFKNNSHDIIVRFNDIYGHPNQSGITVQLGSYNIYIYGNRITGGKYAGILIQRGIWSSHNVENVYIWSNIIYNNSTGAGILVGSSGTSISISNIRIYNNVIANNSGDDYTYTTAGIHIGFGSGHLIKNNIFFDNTGTSGREYAQVYVASGYTSAVTFQHNQGYYTGQTAKVYWGSSGLIDFDSAIAGSNNVTGNPGFTNEPGDDYTLLDSSACKDTGTDLSNLVGSVIIQGTTYNMYYDNCLDPNNTDFTVTPPSVSVLDQDLKGTAWEKGAYIFEESAPTYYVSQYGSGTGDGTSYANRASIAYHNAGNGVFSVLDGDIIQLTGPITTRIIPPDSGSSGNVITYDGDDGVNPDALIRVTGDKGQIKFDGIDYLTFNQIFFDGQNESSEVGLESWGQSEYITVTKCHFEEHQRKGIAMWNSRYYEGAGTRSACRYWTIGGSAGNGNTFKNVGVSTAANIMSVWWSNNLVFSYNTIYSDKPPFGLGRSGLVIEDSGYVLVEYNNFYNLTNEDGIGGKNADHVIVRYNTSHDMQGGSGDANSQGSGINMAFSVGPLPCSDWYIYGNTSYNNNKVGILVMAGATNVNIWSNLIYTNGLAGIDVVQYSSPTTIKIYNNTIVNSGALSGTLLAHNIYIASATSAIIKNNIFYSSVKQAQVILGSTSGVTMDYNHYHYTGGTSTVYWGGTYYNYNALPGVQEDNATTGNPNFTNLSGNDYTLSGTSPCKDTGVDLSGLAGSVTIRGADGYPGIVSMYWDDGLEDRYVDFSTTPPTVRMIKQDSYGTGWEKGAYVYWIDPGGTNETPSTLMCTDSNYDTEMPNQPIADEASITFYCKATDSDGTIKTVTVDFPVASGVADYTDSGLTETSPYEFSFSRTFSNVGGPWTVTFTCTDDDDASPDSPDTLSVTVGSPPVSDWDRKCDLIIDHDKIDSSLSDFPVLLYWNGTTGNVPSEMLDADDPDGHAQTAAPVGGDIRLYQGAIQLPLEIITITMDNDPANAEFIAWTAVPTISSSEDTTITVQYGATGKSQPIAGALYGSEDVWNSAYEGVWHLHDDNYYDSTGNDEHLTEIGALTQATGKIYQHSDNNNSNANYLEDANDSININGANQNITCEAWFYMEILEGGTDSHSIMGEYNISTGARQYYLGYNSSEYPQFRLSPDGNSNTAAIGSVAMAINTWYHIAGTYDDSNIRVYKDGALQDTEPYTSGISDEITEFRLFRRYYSTTHIDGRLEEVRLSNVARSTAWINATYETANDPNAFMVEGTPEDISGAAIECVNLEPYTEDGSFKEDDRIYFDVSFTIGVSDVTGIPRFYMETGSTDTYANFYSIVDGKMRMQVFVLADTMTSDLEVVTGEDWDLNGGTVTFSDDSTLAQGTAIPGDALSTNADYIIDTTQAITSAVYGYDLDYCTECTPDGLYTTIDEIIKWAIKFSETSLDLNAGPGYPRIQMNTIHETDTIYSYALGLGNTTGTVVMGFPAIPGIRGFLDFTGNLDFGPGGEITDLAGNLIDIDMGILSLIDVASIEVNSPWTEDTPKFFTDILDMTVWTDSSDPCTYFIPGDYGKFSENITCTFNTNVAGTSQLPIILDGNGYTLTGSVTIDEEWWTLRNIIHASLVILFGNNERHEFAIVPSGSILQISGSDCIVTNDTIKGTLDIDTSCAVRNTAVPGTVALANGQILTANYSYFRETKATIETSGGTVIGGNNTFNVSDFGFTDEAGGDFTITSDSILKNTGHDYGYSYDILGISLPQGLTFDVGAYELSYESHFYGDHETLYSDTSTADLIPFTLPDDYESIYSDDSNEIVIIAKLNEYAIYLWRNKNENHSDQITLTWTGQTNVAASSQSVCLQIYNVTTGAWETLLCNTSAASNTEFTLTKTVETNVSEYYDGDDWVTCRIYQHW